LLNLTYSSGAIKVDRPFFNLYISFADAVEQSWLPTNWSNHKLEMAVTVLQYEHCLRFYVPCALTALYYEMKPAGGGSADVIDDSLRIEIYFGSDSLVLLAYSLGSSFGETSTVRCCSAVGD